MKHRSDAGERRRSRSAAAVSVTGFANEFDCRATKARASCGEVTGAGSATVTLTSGTGAISIALI